METDWNDLTTIESMQQVTADLRKRNRELMDAMRLVYELTNPDTIHRRKYKGVVRECYRLAEEALFGIGESK